MSDHERSTDFPKHTMKHVATASVNNINLPDLIQRCFVVYRYTPQGTTEESPSQLVLGRKMGSPLDVIHPDLQRKVKESKTGM